MLAPLLLLVGAVTAASADSGGVRQVVSLDGEWNFSLQQLGAGGSSMQQQQSGTILVPGSWEAQVRPVLESCV